LKGLNGELKTVHGGMNLSYGKLKLLHAGPLLPRDDMKALHAGMKLLRGRLKTVRDGMNVLAGELQMACGELKLAGGGTIARAACAPAPSPWRPVHYHDRLWRFGN
jgi:hypothetical protein